MLAHRHNPASVPSISPGIGWHAAGGSMTAQNSTKVLQGCGYIKDQVALGLKMVQEQDT